MVGCENDGHFLLEHGEVVYEGNRIVFVGRGYAEAVDHIIDAGEAVIGPGFVDLDALFDLDTTVLGFDHHPGWKMGRIWAADYVAQGPRDVYTAEEEAFQHDYALAQLLLHGITTALPIRSILYREWAETYDENARAAEGAERLGIRLYLGPSYRTGLPMVAESGAITMHWNVERGMEGLSEAIRFVQDFDGRANDRIRGFLQPDRIEGCTDNLLIETAKAGAALGCPVRLHCCQGVLELEIVENRWGKRSLQVLEDLGFLDIAPLLPHGNLLGGMQPTPETIEEDLDLLAGSGSTVVHCPLVIARHGDILRSFSSYRDHGIQIGLGTDTFPPDMFLNMHLGAMNSRIAEGSMRTSAADLYTAATIGGANALRRPDLGRLEPGALADIVVFDLTNPFLGQVFDPIQTMVLSGSGRDVRMVIVDGRIVVEDGMIPGVDMEAWHHRSQVQFQKQIESTPERALGHPSLDDLFPPSFPLR